MVATQPANEMPFDRIERELSQLRDLFQRRLLNDRVQKQLADELARQVEAARSDQLRRQVEPVLRQVILVLDRIENAAVPAQESVIVDSIRDELVELLARQGVSRAPALGYPFDATQHQAVGVVGTENPGHDGVVVREIRAGYRYTDRVLRAAEVEVGRLDVPETTAAGSGDG